ncbi:MAG: wax ester/triacylglycerol synthase family O-acyltransferase, partial [Acidobacteriota bacterium]
WIADDTFDLERHVISARLSGAGGQAELEAYVSRLMATPLDFERPLWQFHLIENFQGGSALVGRVHHSIGDGMSLIHVVLGLADNPPDGMGIASRPTLGDLAIGRPSFWHRAWRAVQMGAASAVSLVRVLALPADPSTVLRGRLGVEKRAVWSEPIALDEIKAIGKRLGGTVNDVLLSAMAGALRRYLEQRGQSAKGLNLRAVVPVNLRSPHETALGNKFGLVFLPLPVGHGEPMGRLRALRRRMERIKRSPEPFVVYALLRLFGATTPQILDLALNIFGRKATAVMTNVPGPRAPLVFVGHECESILFWVPQSGKLGMGVSILSYNGWVRVGLATDVGLVPDPGSILDHYAEMLRELKTLEVPAA